MVWEVFNDFNQTSRKYVYQGVHKWGIYFDIDRIRITHTNEKKKALNYFPFKTPLNWVVGHFKFHYDDEFVICKMNRMKKFLQKKKINSFS